jgi:hypothetical protein
MRHIWPIVITAVVTGLFSLLGYTLYNLSLLQQDAAAHSALEFTVQDAAVLQRELTKIMTDIDMRLRLIERDIQWLRNPQFDGSATCDPPPIEDIPEPRYQLESILEEVMPK